MDPHPLPPTLERWITEARPVGLDLREHHRSPWASVLGGLAAIAEILLRMLLVVVWWLLMLLGIPLGLVVAGIAIRHHGAVALGNAVTFGLGFGWVVFGALWIFGVRSSGE